MDWLELCAKALTLGVGLAIIWAGYPWQLGLAASWFMLYQRVLRMRSERRD